MSMSSQTQNPYAFLQYDALINNTKAVMSGNDVLKRLVQVNLDIIRGFQNVTKALYETAILTATLSLKIAELTADLRTTKGKQVVADVAALMSDNAMAFSATIMDMERQAADSIRQALGSTTGGGSSASPSKFMKGLNALMEGGGIGALFLRAFAPPILKMASMIVSVSKQFYEMGKTMIKTQLFAAPMQAFWTGFLEPLEPLTDLLGAFGSVLGTMLLPVIQPIITALMPLLPAFATIANILGNILGPAMTIFMIPLNALVQFFTGTYNADAFMKSIGDAFGKLWDGLVKAVMDFGPKLWKAFSDAFLGLLGIIGQFIRDVFVEAISFGTAWTPTFN